MSNNQQIVMNRIKVTLVEKQKTNRWLAEQMGKSENTIRGGVLINLNHQSLNYKKLQSC